MTHHRTESAVPYPLLFEPIFKAKVWGGRRLERLGKTLPAGQPIGESWEIADLNTTSPSGGGGEPAHSIIRNGSLAGATIGEALRLWGADLLGEAPPTFEGGFPLLIKFLDAHQNLSVQTHPSRAYAQAHPEAHLKHEAWCIVESTPDGRIYRGLRPGVNRDDLVKLVRNGAVVEALQSLPATPGQIVHLPSGVLHALGAGVLVAEIQTPSDTTFRLDDWGRTGRTLHIDEALDCAFDESGAPTVPLADLPAPDDQKIVTEAFTIERVNEGAGFRWELAHDGRSPTIVMCLAGALRLDWGQGDSTALDLAAGDTALAPAAIDGGAVRFASDASMLVVRLPMPT